MSLQRTVFYWFECDQPGCDNFSEEYQYDRPASIEFKGRGTRFARTRGSEDGWSTFSDRDLCPEHSHKAVNRQTDR